MAKLSAYQRNWKRLSNQIRRMEKRGYIFEPGFREELKAKSARSLAQIKTNYLYKQARYLDVETGEVTSGIKRRAAERSATSRKGAVTKRRRKREQEKQYYPQSEDMVIYNLENLLSKLNVPVPNEGITKGGKRTWKPPEVTHSAQQGKAKLVQLLTDILNDEKERQALADRVQSNSEHISALIDVIDYSRYKEEVNVAISKVAEILSPTGLDFAQMQHYDDIAEGWYDDYRYSSSIDPTAYDLYEDE